MPAIYEYSIGDIRYHHSLDSSPDPAAFPMHAHEGNEIYYFISGNGSYVVEGAQYPLYPGMIMIMRAGETHKLQITPDMPYERISMHFPSGIIEEVGGKRLLQPFEARELGERNMYSSERVDAAFIRDCFHLIERCAISGTEHINVLCGLLPVLCELNRAFCDNSTLSGKASSHTAQSIITYINNHITDQLSLDSLSEQFYLSKTQLARIFRKATGSPVWDYIMVKRLLLARQLIRAGESSAEACRKCGFGDYSCFFRAYKKRYGISPSEDK